MTNALRHEWSGMYDDVFCIATAMEVSAPFAMEEFDLVCNTMRKHVQIQSGNATNQENTFKGTAGEC